jgi:deoxyribodipyrimidine photo-lyase
MQTAIVCFRQDLRLSDNPALRAAIESADEVIPVYIFDPEETTGGASRWWLHHSLASLAAELKKRGAELVLLKGGSNTALLELCKTTKASSVHWNRTYDPRSVARDTDLKARLTEQGLQAESYRGNLLFEPWEICNQSKLPFRVFTPFWRACSSKLDQVPVPLPEPRSIRGRRVQGVSLASLEILPRIPWYHGFSIWEPGQGGAQRALKKFMADAANRYLIGRDKPQIVGTSRLSPHFHFGEISSRQVLAYMRAAQAVDRHAGFVENSKAFLRQIGWRDFAHHVMFAFPGIASQPLDPKFAAFKWRTDTQSLGAWQQGCTGIPIVDAGMRELWVTGWMHNRVRMIVGSFLTKNLLIHWHEGLRWFDDTLVDADIANNVFGWQWIAGCGADAAPYFRIFNPIAQSERFDPQGHYLKRWLPELAEVPLPWLHKPFECPPLLLSAAGVTLGREYPWPIVDMKSTRARALEQWTALRGSR